MSCRLLVVVKHRPAACALPGAVPKKSWYGKKSFRGSLELYPSLGSVLLCFSRAVGECGLFPCALKQRAFECVVGL